jgi:predicted DNA binding CopG/RHH family protein
MKRINIYLSEKQDTALREIVKDSGIKYAEHVRRALDVYIKQLKLEKKRESV